MKIFYGNLELKIDITYICFDKLKFGDFIIIPSNDTDRAYYFSDPIIGVKKYVLLKLNNEYITYSEDFFIKINITTQSIELINENLLKNKHLTNELIDFKLRDFHSKLKLNHGVFTEEMPEQKMAIRYLKGHEKVLEIGSNIGRNTMIIAHILGKKNNNNFVTLESDPEIAIQLKENLQINNINNTFVEVSALSKRKLIQRGWETVVSDTLLDGYKNIDIINYEELLNKYKINFDTLVLDCEGAFYYILQDMPEILNNVNLIIMENDYVNYDHKLYIDEVLKKNNFRVDYVESGGWGPCEKNFFEVWVKN